MEGWLDVDGQQTDLDGQVRKVRAGDLAAYREIVTACEAGVRAVLGAMLPDHDAVEDLAQEVFITAYAKLDAYRPGTNFPAWLKQIARNLARNYRKRWYRGRAFRDRYKAQIEQHLGTLIDEIVTVLDEGTVLDALRDCIATLSGERRAVFEAYYAREVTSGELAAEYERSAGWVRLTVHRARRSVAECLRKKGMLPDGQ